MARILVNNAELHVAIIITRDVKPIFSICRCAEVPSVHVAIPAILHVLWCLKLKCELFHEFCGGTYICQSEFLGCVVELPPEAVLTDIVRVGSGGRLGTSETLEVVYVGLEDLACDAI